MAPDKKTASASTPLTYSAWKDAAAAELIDRHGIKANVREKQWRDWFIKGSTPSEAADRARADYEAMRPPVDRSTGRRKR